MQLLFVNLKLHKKYKVIKVKTMNKNEISYPRHLLLQEVFPDVSMPSVLGGLGASGLCALDLQPVFLS